MRNDLCDTCKSFNLTVSDFFGWHSDEGRRPELDDTFHAGKLTEVEARAASCPLCRLVVQAIDYSTPVPFEDKRFYEVRLMWPYVAAGTDLSKPWLRDLRVSCIVWEVPPQSKSTFRYDDLALRFCSLAVVDFRLEQDVTFQPAVRRLSPYLDYTLIRSWVECCLHEHGSDCEPSIEVADFACEKASWFWLIDVHRRCIIRPPARASWVALSYVWGGSALFRTTSQSLATMQTPNALDRCEPPLPQSILDAIELVRQIGMDYLWVDRLCIVQDQRDVKAMAMASMHKVYHLARVTIVSAHGSSVEDGLPGVKASSRGWEQPVEEIIPGLSLAALKNPTITFGMHSAYNKRGWTYEEYILSNRRITFVDGTVYFHCRKELIREELVLGTQNESSSDSFFSIMQDIETATPIFDFTMETRDWKNMLSAFVNAVSTYSERELYREDDILNAFQSVAEVICTRSCTDMYWGIPLLIFDWMLLFQPHSRKDFHLRTGFPSWSWCGWRGKLDLEGTSIQEFSTFMLESKFLDWWIPDDSSFGGLKALRPDWPVLQHDLHCVSNILDHDTIRSRCQYLICTTTHTAIDRIPRKHNVKSLQYEGAALPEKSRSTRPEALQNSLFTWGVSCLFRLAAKNRDHQPLNTELMMTMSKQSSWALFDSNDVWAGFFYPRFNVDELLKGRSLLLRLLLHSSKTFEDDDGSKFSSQHDDLVRKRGVDANRYTRVCADQCLGQLKDSVWRASALTLCDDLDFARKPCENRLSSLVERDWEFANVLGFRHRNDLNLGECIGNGWVLRRALPHAYSPGLSWKLGMLI